MEKFLELYRSELNNLFYQKEKVYKLFNLDPDPIAKNLKGKAETNYLTAMYAIITTPLFYENIVFLTFSANHQVYINDKDVSKAKIIQDIFEGNLNEIKIPLKEKQAFVKEVVNIYIDVLSKSFIDHTNKHPMQYPRDITLAESKKLGFKIEEFIPPSKKSKTTINYQIIDYSGNDSSLSIPTSIDGVPVMKICEDAFSSNSNLLRMYLKPHRDFIIEESQPTNLIYVYIDSSLIHQKMKKKDEYSSSNISKFIKGLNNSRPLFYSSGPFFLSYFTDSKDPISKNRNMPFILSNINFFRSELIYFIGFFGASLLIDFENVDFILLLIYWGYLAYFYLQQRVSVFENKLFNIPQNIIALEKSRLSIRIFLRVFWTILFFTLSSLL
jgi:hypothetical protein